MKKNENNKSKKNNGDETLDYYLSMGISFGLLIGALLFSFCIMLDATILGIFILSGSIWIGLIIAILIREKKKRE